jgi:hypothetical protein
MTIDNLDDLIDSSDIIARIEALTADRDDAGNHWDVTSHEAVELASLEKLAAQAEPYAADWEYGETLIRDSYFETYAQELAEDCGMIDANAAWPARCIDWEQAARELQADYTTIDFAGVTYWIR